MKIKNTILTLMTSSLLMVNLTSCEDFLTEKNPNKLTTDIFYTQLSDCDKGLIAVYNAFKNPEIYQLLSENMRSDIAIQGQKKRSSFDDVFYKQDFNNANPNINSKWAALYKGVFRANQLLEGLEKVKPTLNMENETVSSKWTQIKAQAHLFRGMFYFWISSAFNNGSVPLITTVPLEEKDFYQPLSSADKVKEFYRNELEEALKLGLNKTWDTANKGRVTYYTAEALLGQSYLYDGDYDKAAEYFKDIIDNGGYKLVDVSDNISTKNELNDESILEVIYSLDFNSEFQWSDASLSHTLGMNLSFTGWKTTTPSMWLTKAYEDEMVDPLDPNNWVPVNVDPNTRYQSGDPAEDAEYGYKDDIIFNLCGQEYGYTSTSKNGDTLITHAYVYRQLPKTYTYADKIFDRQTKRNSKTGELYVSDDEHVNPQYLNAIPDVNKQTKYKNLKFKEINGQMCRMREFSRRASYSIVMNVDENVPYYKKPVGDVPAIFNIQDCSYFRKMTNYDLWNKENEGSPVTFGGVNLRVIRLADIYLMYAECLIKGGTDNANIAEALKYVNRVRERAGVVLLGDESQALEFKGQRSFQTTIKPGTTDEPMDRNVITTAEQLMEHLMFNERPLELCIEGYDLRPNDLRRWEVNQVPVSNKYTDAKGIFNVKGRYEWLAKQRYVFRETNYLAEETDDNKKPKDGKMLKVGKNWSKLYPAESYPNDTPWQDYVDASINYGPTVATYPIPNSEVMSNPYLK